MNSVRNGLGMRETRRSRGTQADHGIRISMRFSPKFITRSSANCRYGDPPVMVKKKVPSNAIAPTTAQMAVTTLEVRLSNMRASPFVSGGLRGHRIESTLHSRDAEHPGFDPYLLVTFGRDSRSFFPSTMIMTSTAVFSVVDPRSMMRA